MNRVVINEHGEAVPLFRAIEMDIFPKVAFKRKDGWVLGAPKEFESIAYRMWKDEWVEFSRRDMSKTGRVNWRPIGEY